MKLARILKGAALSLAIATSALFLSACNDLEESAKPVVTQIIHEKLGGTATCVNVELKGKVQGKDKTWNAVATLDNGKKIDIIIEDRDDQIYVDMTDGFVKAVVEEMVKQEMNSDDEEEEDY